MFLTKCGHVLYLLACTCFHAAAASRVRKSSLNREERLLCFSQIRSLACNIALATRSIPSQLGQPTAALPAHFYPPPFRNLKGTPVRIKLLSVLAPLCALMLAASTAGSQTARPVATGHDKQAVPDLVPSPPTVAGAPVREALPQPTEVQRLKLENLQLKATLLSQQQQALQQEYGALVQAIIAEHPGYIWNPQTASLQPAPKPAPQPKPAVK
jgi:hypothetical protein